MAIKSSVRSPTLRVHSLPVDNCRVLITQSAILQVMPGNDIDVISDRRDETRPVATSPDQYTLTIDEAATRYEHAGHPRTIRSIQRYCAKGHLDSLRQETTFGDKYLITPESVARHIAQIAELASATSRDVPRLDVPSVIAPTQPAPEQQPVTTTDDQSRQDAARRIEPEVIEPVNRYVQQLERENSFLRDQIAVKDAQISESSVRARETNVLIKGLQELFLALNPGRSEARNQNNNGASAGHSQVQ